MIKLSYKPSRSHYRVFSAISSNFVVLEVGAIFGTREPVILTGLVFGAMIALYLAMKTQELSEGK